MRYRAVGDPLDPKTVAVPEAIAGLPNTPATAGLLSLLTQPLLGLGGGLGEANAAGSAGAGIGSPGAEKLGPLAHARKQIARFSPSYIIIGQ